MFAVLQIEKASYGIKEVFSRRNRIYHEYKRVLNRRYACLHYVKRKKIDFDAIYNYSPRLSNGILLDDSIEIPDGSMVVRYNPHNFLVDVCLNTMIKAVNGSQIPMYKRSVSLVDTRGIYSKYIERLVHHFTAITVYTQNEELYQKVSENIMEKYGATLVLTENPESCNRSAVIFCPDKVLNFAKSNALVFTPYGTDICKNVVSDFEIKIMPNLLESCPHGIDPLDFTAILWETCKVSELRGQYSRKMRFNGLHTTLESISEHLRKDIIFI